MVYRRYHPDDDHSVSMATVVVTEFRSESALWKQGNACQGSGLLQVGGKEGWRQAWLLCATASRTQNEEGATKLHHLRPLKQVIPAVYLELK